MLARGQVVFKVCKGAVLSLKGRGPRLSPFPSMHRITLILFISFLTPQKVE